MLDNPEYNINQKLKNTIELRKEIDQKKAKTFGEFVPTIEDKYIMTDADLPENDQLAKSVGTRLCQLP